MYIPFIGLRYLRSRLISILGVLGVAAGVGLILIVTSVMSGFAKEMRARIRGTTSHISVTARFGEFIQTWEPAFRALLEMEEVVGAAPRLEWMVLREDGQGSGWIVGIDPEFEKNASELQQYIHTIGSDRVDFRLRGQEGEHPGAYTGLDRPIEPGMILPTGGTFTLTSVRRKERGFMPVQMTFQEVGYYFSGLAEYDVSHVIVELEAAQDFLQMPGAITRFCVAVKNWDDTETLERTRAKVFEKLYPFGTFQVLTWEDERRTFLRAVETERKLNAILMFFIVGVAALVIACFLAMMVTEKRKDIGVLSSLGATVRGVMMLFLFQGFFISVLGSALGVAWGAAVALNLNPIADRIHHWTGYHPFPPDVYLLARIPSNVSAETVSTIVFMTVLCGSFFSLFPAWKAGRLDPVEALRYE